MTPIHSKVYLMKPYVIKFVSDLQKVDDFLKKLDTPTTKV
jgi:hypothetical protein